MAIPRDWCKERPLPRFLQFFGTSHRQWANTNACDPVVQSQVQNNLVLPNNTLPDAVQNVAYAEFIKPGGGTPPYHFALGQNATLPAGFSLDPVTGEVSGTPTASLQNADFFMVVISDSASTPATISPFVSLNVQPPLSFQTTTLQTSRGV